MPGSIELPSANGNDERRSSITVRSLSGGVVVVLHGDHDLSTKPQLMEALRRVRRRSRLVIDLQRCTFVDSTIIGATLGAFQADDPGEPKLSVVLPDDTSYVYRALSVIGLHELVPAHLSVEAALGRPLGQGRITNDVRQEERALPIRARITRTCRSFAPAVSSGGRNHPAPRRMRVHGARPPVIRCTSDLEYPGRGRTRHAGGIAVRGASREAFVTGRTWLRRTAARRGRFAARRVVSPRGTSRRARAGFSRRRAPRATRRASARGRRRPRACRSRRSRRWRTRDEPLGSATCQPESWLPPSARRRGWPSPRLRSAAARRLGRACLLGPRPSPGACPARRASLRGGWLPARLAGASAVGSG